MYRAGLSSKVSANGQKSPHTLKPEDDGVITVLTGNAGEISLVRHDKSDHD